MNIKTIALLIPLTVIAGGAVWYKTTVGKIPSDCRIIYTTSTGYYELTLEDMKKQLQLLESPEVSLTPGIDVQAKRIRNCIDRIEGKWFRTR